MAILVIIFMYAIWSSMFSIAKWSLQFSPPLFLIASRMLLAAVLVLGFLLFFKKSEFKLHFKKYLSLALLGVFSIYLSNIFELWGLQHLSASKTCFIYSLSPFFAALFSYLHFQEKMSPKKWLGMVIGFLGFIPVLFTMGSSQDFLYISVADLFVMGAALCAVYGWVLLRLVVKDASISPLMANGISMLFGGMLALSHSYFTENWTPFPIALPQMGKFLLGTLVMTFISSILCYNLYGLMLRKFTATFLSFVGLLSPIFASFNSWVILGEIPSPIIFLSTGIVILGLWLVYQEELKQGYIKKMA